MAAPSRTKKVGFAGRLSRLSRGVGPRFSIRELYACQRPVIYRAAACLSIVLGLLAGPCFGAITSSVIVFDRPEPNGQRWVCERHTDHLGRVEEVIYMAAAGTNAATAMTARVAQIEAAAKERELQANLANALSDDAPDPKILYSTKVEFGSVLREAFRVSKGRDTMRLGWYVSSFGLTDVQTKNLFGLNDAQLTAFKAKLVTWTANYNAMQAEAGQ